MILQLFLIQRLFLKKKKKRAINSFELIFMFLAQIRTVQVRNLSDLASEREIHEFFSFSGDIEHIEIRGLVFLCFSFT